MRHFLFCLIAVFIIPTVHAQDADDGCGQLPPNVQKAMQEAMQYRNSCPITDNGQNNTRYFAVNDYSGCQSGDKPTMYIFDISGDGHTSGVHCVFKTLVNYGNGKGHGCPEACDDSNSHLTPPGFHIVESHNSAKFSSSQCWGLTGLEGQDSTDRGILIHPTESGQGGVACTWGCSGVPYQNFQKVKSLLTQGSLVYNYFGDNPQAAPGCRKTSGLTNHNPAQCRLDSGASTDVYGNKSSGSGNAIR